MVLISMSTSLDVDVIFCDVPDPKFSFKSFFFWSSESFSNLCWWISISSFQHLWAFYLLLFTCSSCAPVSMTQPVSAHSCPLTERCANIRLLTVALLGTRRWGFYWWVTSNTLTDITSPQILHVQPTYKPSNEMNNIVTWAEIWQFKGISMDFH